MCTVNHNRRRHKWLTWSVVNGNSHDVTDRCQSNIKHVNDIIALRNSSNSSGS